MEPSVPATSSLARVGIGLLASIPLMVIIFTVARPKAPCACSPPQIEAVDGLQRIQQASANYFRAPRVDPVSGATLPCRFPASEDTTPPVGPACCDGSGGLEGRCNVDSARWDSPTWTALNFRKMDVHRFHYAYRSGGEGSTAFFTATAYADMDCDGAWSTFEIYGSGAIGEGGACEFRGSSALFKVDETE